jgi:Gas vesicle protein K
VRRKTSPRAKAPARRRRPAGTAPASRVKAVSKAELASLRAALQGAGRRGPSRWNADPDDVQRSVARLVLALVEFLRQLMERQAIRRMEAGTLDPGQVEAMGLALMRLEETLQDLAARFGLTREELNLDLGPLGRLM